MCLEIMPWLSRYFDAERLGPIVLERNVADGITVKGLLDEITSRNQELKEVIFDERTGRLAGHVWIILNGRLLELSGGLETKLQDGDTIRLMAGIVGG
jgi:molybdopterin converting factor small subunit